MDPISELHLRITDIISSLGVVDMSNFMISEDLKELRKIIFHILENFDIDLDDIAVDTVSDL
tara:strand:- start:290 stop:475 length:186 start_codon:yes stop_codon:yes gene_type:complete